MGIIFIALVIGLRARAANRPPNVSGTLRYWPAEEDHSKTTEVDLTAFRKPALTIGSDSANEIAVPKSGLAAQHAVLKAVTSSTGVQVMLEPYGEIHKGYVTLNAPTALQHGDEFIMGALVFQYLSDTGE